jgi:signal peptidase II
MKRRWAIFVAVGLVTLALDQGSKAWARTLPVPAGCHVPGDLIAFKCGGIPQPVVDGYWDWELAFNPGAAFSSFIGGDVARVLLMIIAFGAVIAIAVAVGRSKPEQRLQRVAYAMIAGGALGNLVDRLRDGAVTDFVRWRIHDHRWPIFNVADAALAIGVGLLLLESVFARRAQKLRTA